MRSAEARSEIFEIVQRRNLGRALSGAKEGGAVRVELKPLPKRAKVGIWVWVFLLGADLAYELFAFADGSGGQPTASQLLKGLVRAGGLAGVVGCICALFGAAIVLSFHLALQWF
jgi:hypothetical protein